MPTSDSRRFRSRLGLLLAICGAVGAALALWLALGGIATAAPANPLAPQDTPEGLGEAWTLTGATVLEPTAPCAENGLLLDTEQALTTGIPFIQETIVSAGDQIYMAERLVNNFGGSGSGSVLLYAVDDLGIVNASFPLPVNTPLTVQMTLYQGLAQTPAYRTVGTVVCNNAQVQVLQAGPLAPFPALAEIQGRSGTDCSAGGVSLSVDHNQDLGQPYQLNTVIRDSSDAIIQNTQMVISGTLGEGSLPLQEDLPPGQTLSATLTLRDMNDRPLYRSQAAFQCDSGFNNFVPGTPVQPLQPALTLVEPALQGCNSGDTVFHVNQITEAGQSYYYGMQVRLGTSTLLDLYERDSLNGLPQQPGLNLWRVDADLPTTNAVQVELSLYDDQQRPRYRTTFDYICASSQPVQQLEATPLPFLYLPAILKP